MQIALITALFVLLLHAFLLLCHPALMAFPGSDFLQCVSLLLLLDIVFHEICIGILHIILRRRRRCLLGCLLTLILLLLFTLLLLGSGERFLVHLVDVLCLPN